MSETRYCPTCGDTDLTLTTDTPVDGWSELACKTCLRVLEIGRPGLGPLVDPLWVERGLCEMYWAERNLVYVLDENDERQLFLTVHQTKDNPVPVEDQAKILANMLNGRKTHD